jgi:glutaredoxin-like protein NrdH
MTVTIFSKPTCVQCEAPYRALDKRGISYQVCDLTSDESALDRVRQLGFLQAPVVLADGINGTASGVMTWSGFRPDEIDELAHHLAGAA